MKCCLIQELCVRYPTPISQNIINSCQYPDSTCYFSIPMSAHTVSYDAKPLHVSFDNYLSQFFLQCPYSFGGKEGKPILLQKAQFSSSSYFGFCCSSLLKCSHSGSHHVI